MAGYLHKVQHSDVYHGTGKKPPFFEGWYYKLIDATEQHRLAVIPGVFIAQQGSHGFVQLLNGSTGESSYHPFPLEQFQASDETLDVCVAASQFTGHQLHLAIEEQAEQIRGQIAFDGLTPLPDSFWSPGIMGPFSWLTFMECYHGIVSLNHTLRGSLTINGRTIDFTGGKGYIEKDWGQAFPSAYIWQQTNHFDGPDTCLSASIAMIPSFGLAFRGFIIAFWHQGQHYRFATYNGAHVRHLNVDDTHVTWVVTRGDLRLEMRAERAEGGLLHAPIRTEMHRRVKETLQARIEVVLTRGRTTLFSGTGRCAGLEVYGDLERLLKA